MQADMVGCSSHSGYSCARGVAETCSYLQPIALIQRLEKESRGNYRCNIQWAIIHAPNLYGWRLFPIRIGTP